MTNEWQEKKANEGGGKATKRTQRGNVRSVVLMKGARTILEKAEAEITARGLTDVELARLLQ